MLAVTAQTGPLVPSVAHPLFHAGLSQPDSICFQPCPGVCLPESLSCFPSPTPALPCLCGVCHCTCCCAPSMDACVCVLPTSRAPRSQVPCLTHFHRILSVLNVSLVGGFGIWLCRLFPGELLLEKAKDIPASVFHVYICSPSFFLRWLLTFDSNKSLWSIFRMRSSSETLKQEAWALPSLASSWCLLD